MKRLSVYFVGLFLMLLSQGSLAQKAWVVPARFNPGDSVTLFVDVSKTDCQRLINSTDDIYIWIWQPADPIIGNGTWTASNSDLLMKRDPNNPNIYSFSFVCTEFFVGIKDNPALIYKNNFHFLAKKKDGTGLGGGGCDEDKTEDLEVEALPIPGCNSLFCKFPQTFMQDDYFTFIYNNTFEPKEAMWESNVGVDNFYVFTRATLSDGTKIQYVDWDVVGQTPELQLVKDPADGFYKMTMIPEEFFSLAPGQEITEIEFVVRKKVFVTPDDKSDQKSTMFVGCN